MIDVKLDDNEQALKSKILSLRNKIVAHSDESHMHFRASRYQFQESGILFPHIEFEETLFLTQNEHRQLEELLHTISCALARHHFDITQINHELSEAYVKPDDQGRKVQ